MLDGCRFGGIIMNHGPSWRHHGRMSFTCHRMRFDGYIKAVVQGRDSTPTSNTLLKSHKQFFITIETRKKQSIKNTSK